MMYTVLLIYVGEQQSKFQAVFWFIVIWHVTQICFLLNKSY